MYLLCRIIQDFTYYGREYRAGEDLLFERDDYDRLKKLFPDCIEFIKKIEPVKVILK